MIENLIAQVLCEPEISGEIAKYAGEPAVFYQNAPNDQASGWGDLQYPRLDYIVDWQFNPERKASGSVAINVWCLNSETKKKPPEDIGEIIRDHIKDVFLTDDGETYALEWQRTDAFEAGGGNEPIKIGVSLLFDILAFPVQLTTDPDPIEGTNQWIKALFPNAKVIGMDNMPPIYRPTEDSPVIYARLQTDGSSMRNSYSVAWMRVNIQIHVFAPDTTTRQNLCRVLLNQISMDGEVRLTDKSPMLIKRTTLSISNPPLRQGQITITGDYGVLRKKNPVEKLKHPSMEYEVKV